MNKKSFFTLFPVLIFIFILLACRSHTRKQQTKSQKESSLSIGAGYRFNSDSAYYFVRKQLSFGPRVPNTKGHYECALYFQKILGAYCDTLYVQEAAVTAHDKTQLLIKNFIASFNPANPKRIFFCAHWDTRPYADRDTTDQNKPFPAANDGASGVAVILEISRILHSKPVNYGLDIILFDAEDYGKEDYDDSYCLGSQYWSKNLHIKNYFPAYGILLDMVGAENSEFPREGTSEIFASDVVDLVWNAAEQLGYGKYFVSRKEKSTIIDDHYYINTIAHIKTIDIIHRDEAGMFHPSWHTHRDNLEVIDKNTLQAVGQTLLEVLIRQAHGERDI